MFRVTVTSTDPALIDSLRPVLGAAGYDVVVLTGAEQTDLDSAAAPDVLVLDLRNPGPPPRLPLMESWPEAPSLAVLTPRQIADLDPTLGLDDFITTPLDVAECLARVQQILWRHGRAAGRNVVTTGDLMLDSANYQVFESGRPLLLTYKEYELLRFLMTHADTAFTRETLLNRVWGYDFYGGSRTVDVHVRRLRSKLEDARYHYIETVRNVGYRFAPVLR